MSATPTETHTARNDKVAEAREKLDAWVREVVAWHFDPATGCPFWLEQAAKLDWDPRQEIQAYADLRRFGLVAARRPGAPLGTKGLRRPARLHL